MDRLMAVVILTAVIHLINTLMYSVRVSGVRTGRLATAISLFNVVFLLSSTANMIQGPIMAAMVEDAIHRGGLEGFSGRVGMDVHFPPGYREQLDILAWNTRLVMLAATAGTLLGALLLPMSVELFVRAIMVFDRAGSVPGMMLMALFSRRRLAMILREIRISGRGVEAPGVSGMPLLFLAMNVVVTGVFTTGVLSALYAGALYPAYRASATMMASIVNGVAQVLFATVVDPAAARVTDQALQGMRPESDVRRMACLLAASRLLGTVLAQGIFLPAAHLIKYAALFMTRNTV